MALPDSRWRPLCVKVFDSLALLHSAHVKQQKKEGECRPKCTQSSISQKDNLGMKFADDTNYSDQVSAQMEKVSSGEVTFLTPAQNAPISMFAVLYHQN